MPPVSVLVKPASSMCNMKCSYCFYNDIAGKREVFSNGIMSDDTIEKVISSACEYSDGYCSFMFQGGEPTLAGLDFYKKVIELQNKYKKSYHKISNAIQTNGYAIDKSFAQFLHDNDFLVGLSLDGPADIHNLNRTDKSGDNTFNKVMNTVRLFNKFDVKFNVLCVVTGRNARSIEKIYNFYKKNNLRYLQFIACLDPIGEERGLENFHLSSVEYGNFLIKLFDLWYADFIKGNYISIRHIDNWLSALAGFRTEACNMTGCCSVQNVIESDGSVYPCDFYCTDEWKLGNINSDSLDSINKSDKAKSFVEQSLTVPLECSNCKFYSICRNGCRRERAQTRNKYEVNFYCEAYKTFFSKRYNQMIKALNIIKTRQY